MIILIGCAPLNAADTAHYSNPGYKVELDYPSAWILRDGAQVPDGIVLKLFMPKAPEDVFHKNMYVTVQDMGARPVNLEEYRRVVDKQIIQSLPGGKILQVEPAELGGYPAYQTLCSTVAAHTDIKILNVYTIKNNKAYIVVYTATAQDFDIFLPQAQEVIRSFQFED